MADRYYDRDERDRYDRDHGEFSGRGERTRGREPQRGEPHRDEGRYARAQDRDFMERAGDEVRSWFGDEEASRRREIDERRQDRDRGADYGRGDQPWRGERRQPDDWSTRDYVPRGSGIHAGGVESRDWAMHERDRQRGRDYGTPGDTGWRTSGRGRDVGDDDRGWMAGGPHWGREFGWGTEGREQGGRSTHSYWTGGTSESSGRFTGRGPRGYQRSDERIREDVCDRLTQHGDIDASNIEVEVVGAEVTLRGTTESRYARRAAEDIAETIQGVKHVRNEVRVEQPGDVSGTGGASGGMNAGPGGAAGATVGSKERVR